jgi:uncharacterized protein (UPF0210 family)
MKQSFAKVVKMDQRDTKIYLAMISNLEAFIEDANKKAKNLPVEEVTIRASITPTAEDLKRPAPGSVTIVMWDTYNHGVDLQPAADEVTALLWIGEELRKEGWSDWQIQGAQETLRDESYFQYGPTDKPSTITLHTLEILQEKI